MGMPREVRDSATYILLPDRRGVDSGQDLLGKYGARKQPEDG
jgi:hypothetical protein